MIVDVDLQYIWMLDQHKHSEYMFASVRDLTKFTVCVDRFVKVFNTGELIELNGLNTKAENFVKITLLPKIYAHLEGKGSSEANKNAIFKIIKGIPAEYENDFVFGWLLIGFQGAVTKLEVKKNLNSYHITDIVAEIVSKHLYFLAQRSRSEYQQQFKKYSRGEYPLIDAVLMTKISTRVSAMGATKGRLTKSAPLKLNPQTRTVKVKNKSASNTYAGIFEALSLTPAYGSYGENYYADFVQKLEESFNSVKGQSLVLLFTPKQGVTWDQVKRDSALMFRGVDIEVKEVIEQKEKRERTLILEEIKADVNHDLTSKDQARQRVKATNEILEELKYWDQGRLTCSYLKGNFSMVYFPENVFKDKPIDIKAQFSSLESMLRRIQNNNSVGVIYFYEGLIRDTDPDEAEDFQLEIPDYDNTNCLDFLEQAQEQRFVDCYKSQRRAYADKVKAVAKGAGDVLAEIAEILNPADPTNLAFLGIVKTIRAANFSTSGLKLVKFSAIRVFITRRRWGAKGAELIEKVIKDRGSLRRSFERIGVSFEAHHVIPVDALKERKAVQAAVIGGLKFNDALVNGYKVEADLHHLVHWVKYNEWVKNEINKWESDNLGFTAREAKKFLINDLIPRARKTLDEVINEIK